MIDILKTISLLQEEKQKEGIFPDHIPLPDLKNKVQDELRDKLNKLFKEGKIGTVNSLNNTCIYVKDG